MASDATLSDDLPVDQSTGAALQHDPWRRQSLLSRALQSVERFLGDAGFDRAPWLAVAFAAGIAAWFGLDTPLQWFGFAALGIVLAFAGFALHRRDGRSPFLWRAFGAVCLAAALGCLVVWSKSALVSPPQIERPTVAWFDATILQRQEQPAQDRVRLILATRMPDTGEAIRIRVNLPDRLDKADVAPAARVRVRARLMPPSPPMLPGGYNFARAAWFKGLTATGSVIAPVEIVTPGQGGSFVKAMQQRLSRHVRARMEGSGGGIAATLASGDRGAIAEDDAQAMRDAGLAHLLSISGLHVSAVIAATYLIALKLFALWPWLALRVRLPVLAAGTGALAGISYTLLTGAQVPTVRACVGALLVLVALAMGREALSLRVLAVAAFIVLLFWPESLVGPSFQMSFAAVMAIVSLNSSDKVRAFLGPREEGLGRRFLRYTTMLFLTGLVIEFVLMPIALHHFHRAGIYGAFANVIAIPLTTVVVMPLIACALFLDAVGAGAPVWWLADKAIEFILAIAHWVSSRPGAVTTMPAMGLPSFLLFVSGGLWLALWHGRIRYWGAVPAAVGAFSLAQLEPPDMLVSGDGRHVGITGQGTEELLVIRKSQSEYVSENLSELAGMDGTVRLLSQWRGAQCNEDFCAVQLIEDGKTWHVLIARSRNLVPERALAAACDRADIVIADRWLPRSCAPRWLKADRRLLSRTGGIAIDLGNQSYRTVAQGQGRHGWWPADED